MPSRHSIVLNPRRVAALGTSLAVFAVIVGFHGAVARNDDGSKTFFLSSAPSSFEGGDGERSLPEKPAARVKVARISRQVTDAKTPIRLQPRLAAKAQVGGKAKAAEAKVLVKPVSGPVTLLTDVTLMRGDAVMTMRGIRIFTGAMAFPHRDGDFVALGGVGGLPRSVSRTLLAMDSVPRT